METITYSRVDKLDIQLDLYLPPELKEGLVPALVFFHGGGMIAGCRKTLFFQQWLKSGSHDLLNTCWLKSMKARKPPTNAQPQMQH